MSPFVFHVETGIDGSRIWQTVSTEFDGVRTELTRQVYETRELQLLEALIRLGWTPPFDANKAIAWDKIAW